MTLEEQLALIDNGSLAGAEGKAALYASLLGALSPHCVESRQQIGDMAANAREIVKDRTGRTESIEGILRGWRDAASSLGPDAKCSDVLAGMLVLMTK
jgi:hypothetical protein